jgi:hypothetical protein
MQDLETINSIKQRYAVKWGTHFDGTVKDRLKFYFVEQLVRKYVRIRVILLPHLLPPINREKQVIW